MSSTRGSQQPLRRRQLLKGAPDDVWGGWGAASGNFPHVKSRVKCVLAAFVICMAIIVSVPNEAKADYQFGPGASTGSGFGPPDSNRYVPEYNGLVGDCYDGRIGVDRYYYDYQAYYGPVVHYIYYDTCDMNRMGAGSTDYNRLYRHERAHSRGFAHYEGSPSYNGAYYPTIRICGC